MIKLIFFSNTSNKTPLRVAFFIFFKSSNAFSHFQTLVAGALFQMPSAKTPLPLTHLSSFFNIIEK
jgi:hypothetical protein